MRYIAYAVHDQKADSFMMPFFFPNDNLAIRGFTDAINDKNTPFGKHPADYTLFSIGQYNELKGELVQTDNTPIGNGVEYLKQTTTQES